MDVSCGEAAYPRPTFVLPPSYPRPASVPFPSWEGCPRRGGVVSPAGTPPTSKLPYLIFNI
ncbi:MAG: hypothetical protein LBM98_04290 [Oscillospiraceae bacterium]|nr:hypothetical protein [Oscillospiraceae bacterium]